MKSIKYLLLGLAVGLISTSCEKRTIEFDWTESTGKVSYQVFNTNLMANSSENAIDYLYINGKEYTNNHSALISPYNFAPSGTVGAFYTIDPCSSINISLVTEQSVTQRDENGAPIKDEKGNPIINYTTEEVYNNVAEYNFEADKKYHIFVYDYSKAPKVIEEIGVPIQEIEVDSLGNNTKSGLRLFNFLWDEKGVPTTGKIKYCAKTKKSGDYRWETDWIAFGEASEWHNIEVNREHPDNGSGFNSSGYEIIYCDILLSYDEGATTQKVVNNDYWTTYIGRAYQYIIVGDVAKGVKTPEIMRFTAL